MLRPTLASSLKILLIGNYITCSRQLPSQQQMTITLQKLLNLNEDDCPSAGNLEQIQTGNVYSNATREISSSSYACNNKLFYLPATQMEMIIHSTPWNM